MGGKANGAAGQQAGMGAMQQQGGWAGSGALPPPRAGEGGTPGYTGTGAPGGWGSPVSGDWARRINAGNSMFGMSGMGSGAMGWQATPDANGVMQWNQTQGAPGDVQKAAVAPATSAPPATVGSSTPPPASAPPPASTYNYNPSMNAQQAFDAWTAAGRPETSATGQQYDVRGVPIDASRSFAEQQARRMGLPPSPGAAPSLQQPAARDPRMANMQNMAEMVRQQQIAAGLRST